VSSFVTFLLFARPALLALAGSSPQRVRAHATLAEPAARLATRTVAPDVKIVPILCGSFSRSVYEGGLPEDDENVRRFFGALGDLAARRADEMVFVLGVDMAHMGRRYGDQFTANAGRGEMLDIEQRDRARIHSMETGDARGFWEQVQTNQDDLKVISGQAEVLAPVEKIKRARVAMPELTISNREGRYRADENLPRDAFTELIERFWRETEADFGSALKALREKPDDPERSIREDFLRALKRKALQLFDDIAGMDDLAAQDARRIVEARSVLQFVFSETGSIRGALDLLTEEAKQKAGKRRAAGKAKAKAKEGVTS